MSPHNTKRFDIPNHTACDFGCHCVVKKLVCCQKRIQIPSLKRILSFLIHQPFLRLFDHIIPPHVAKNNLWHILVAALRKQLSLYHNELREWCRWVVIPCLWLPRQRKQLRVQIIWLRPKVNRSWSPIDFMDPRWDDVHGSWPWFVHEKNSTIVLLAADTIQIVSTTAKSLWIWTDTERAIKRYVPIYSPKYGLFDCLQSKF